jgi:surface protein
MNNFFNLNHNAQRVTLLLFLITILGYSQTPITNANFQTAINTCLSTNPFDGECSSSEYGAIPDWDVSQVTDMSDVFASKQSFIGDLSSWDVSSVTNMHNMFLLASSFNGDVGSWDVSSVNNMHTMFLLASSFNGDVSSWDVSSVVNMNQMFYLASSFNGDLGSWDVTSVIDMSFMLNGTTLSTDNYDKILNSWSEQNLTQNVIFDAMNLNYCIGEAGRQKMIDNFGWRISDDGKECPVNIASNVNGMWSNVSNWSRGVVPTSADNVVIPSGATLKIGDDISDVNSLVNEGTIVIQPTFSLKSNTTIVNNGTIVLDSEGNNSSVLFVSGNSTGNVVYKRGGLKANQWSLVTSPVSGQKIKEFAINPDNALRINTNASPNRYAIGYFDGTAAAGEQWSYYDTNVSSSATFTAGESYSMSRASDGTLEFTGTLTTTDTSKNLSAGFWSPIGNPYTTYYPATKNGESSFLNENYNALDDEFKGVYLWSTLQNKYVLFSELDVSSRFLAPGQGFFIKLKVGANSVLFNQDKRSLKPVDGNTAFAKNDDLYAELALGNDSYEVNTLIRFYSHATTGFDVGYDIRNFDGATFDLYTHLIDKSLDHNFSIQSIPNTDFENSIVPLGLNLTSTESIKLSLNAVNLPEGIHVVIEDRLLETFNQMDADNSFTPDFSKHTETKDRFFVHFKTSAALSTERLDLDKVSIFINNRLLQFKGIENSKVVKIFNMIGQEILNKQLDMNTNEINLPQHLESGVYLVSVAANNQTTNQKVILK